MEKLDEGVTQMPKQLKRGWTEAKHTFKSSKQQQSEGTDYLSREVRDRLKQMFGIFMPVWPKGTPPPELPQNITAISWEELGRLQGSFTTYANYVNGVLALAEIDELERIGIYSILEASVRLRSGGTVQYRKDEAVVDPGARAAKEKLDSKKAYKTFLASRMAQLERCIRVLSREQSRREHIVQRTT